MGEVGVGEERGKGIGEGREREGTGERLRLHCTTNAPLVTVGRNDISTM